MGDEIVGWHHWLNGHESEQILRDKPGVPQSTGLQRVGHNLVTEQQQQRVSIPGLEGPSYLTLWCFSSLGWGQGWEWPNTALCLIWSSHSSGHPATWSCLFARVLVHSGVSCRVPWPCSLPQVWPHRDAQTIPHICLNMTFNISSPTVCWLPAVFQAPSEALGTWQWTRWTRALLPEGLYSWQVMQGSKKKQTRSGHAGWWE